MAETERIIHKRRRTALSCYRCRSRKVKCGRELPSCLRCVKGGFAESCNYDPGAAHSEKFATRSITENASNGTGGQNPEDNFWAPGQPGGRPSEYTFVNGVSDPVPEDRPTHNAASIQKTREGEIFELKGRVDALLQDLIGGTCNPRQNPHYPLNISGWSKGEPAASAEGIFFRGKSFKTQYYGPSHLFSFVGEFPDLSDFMRDLMNQIPVMRKARNELIALRDTEEVPSVPGNKFKREKLLELMPPRHEADSLLQIYFNTFETTFRILHVPRFRKQYEEFWLAPDEAQDSLLVVLLLVITVVYCIPSLDQLSFVGFSSTRRNRAIESIEVCSLWLQQHSQKHTTIAYFQAHCLLHLAKRMNIVKVKRIWTSAGHLLRIAMSAGLHREPSLLGHKVSVYDQEIRRRLWATIAEFEIHDSLDRGMVPAIREGTWDSRPPLNINDEDFDLDCQSLPPSKPIADYTDTAFLHLSAQTLSYRAELVALINRVSSSLSYEQVLAEDQKLMESIDEIPHWRSDENTILDKQSQNRALLPRSLLWLQLQQFLILLHRPFAQSGCQISRYRYSRSSCLTSAIAVLNRYTRPDVVHDFSLVVMRTDLFRAAFSLCYDLVTINSSQYSFDTVPPLIDNGESTVPLIETALKFLEDKVMRLGQAMHQYLFLVSAACLAQMRLKPLEISKLQKNAADRMTYLCYRVLSSQAGGSYNPPNNTPATLLQSMAMPTNGFPTPSVSDLGPVMPNLNEFSIDSFSQADLWAWDMDDIWNS